VIGDGTLATHRLPAPGAGYDFARETVARDRSGDGGNDGQPWSSTRIRLGVPRTRWFVASTRWFVAPVVGMWWALPKSGSPGPGRRSWGPDGPRPTFRERPPHPHRNHPPTRRNSSRRDQRFAHLAYLAHPLTPPLLSFQETKESSASISGLLPSARSARWRVVRDGRRGGRGPPKSGRRPSGPHDHLPGAGEPLFGGPLPPRHPAPTMRSTHPFKRPAHHPRTAQQSGAPRRG
jgi:hypothetical protein